ncbi:hypothetical protein HAV15_011185 [Penicillium sp. str. |nr:hypothetical protein HAV15_011185 [Penicillium sp. str. \
MADSALPNLYRLYFGNTDDDNTTLTSTEDLDKPTPVIRWSHTALRNDFSSNFHIASIQEPPQIDTQVGGTDVRYINTPLKFERPVHRARVWIPWSTLWERWR